MLIYLLLSPRVRQKLANKIPPVSEQEIWQCFRNRRYGLLEDIRRKNRTWPPTLWFIAKTDRMRKLKIVFICKTEGHYTIKTAYDPDKNEEFIYEKKLNQSSNKKQWHKEDDKYLDDVELWDSKKLGADIRYAKRASAAVEKALDDDWGLEAISIRLQKSLLKKLRTLAERDGIGYQPYIRQVLTRHARENRITTKRTMAS